MISQDLQDLIPFYLNGTLSTAERQRFEQALQSSAELRQALTEWQQIQAATRQWAATRTDTSLPPLNLSKITGAPPTAADLPPLRVLHNPNPSTPPPQTAPLPRGVAPAARARGGIVGMSVTLAASVVVMLFVGVLLFSAFNRQNNGATGSGQGVAVLPSGTPDDAALKLPETPQPTQPLPTAILPPTVTPVPTLSRMLPTPIIDAGDGLSGIGGGGFGGGFESDANMSIMGGDAPNVAMAPFGFSASEPNPSGNCYVTNTVEPIDIYEYADNTARVVARFNVGERYDTWVQNATGTFYQIFMPNNTPRLAWVEARRVELYAADGGLCSGLLLPTPTQPPPTRTPTEPTLAPTEQTPAPPTLTPINTPSAVPNTGG